MIQEQIGIFLECSSADCYYSSPSGENFSKSDRYPQYVISGSTANIALQLVQLVLHASKIKENRLGRIREALFSSLMSSLLPDWRNIFFEIDSKQRCFFTIASLKTKEP